jgi:hypothetical protein
MKTRILYNQWQVVNVFIATSVSSNIIEVATRITKDLSGLPELLAQTVPTVCSGLYGTNFKFIIF